MNEYTDPEGEEAEREEREGDAQPVSGGLAGALAKTIAGIRRTYGPERAAECTAEVHAALNGSWQPSADDLAELATYKERYHLDLIDNRDVWNFQTEEAHAADCAHCRGKCLHPGPYEGLRFVHTLIQNDDGQTEAVFFVERCSYAHKRRLSEERRRAMHLSGLPKRYEFATWADAPDALRYAQSEGSLFLSGPVGCGKTLVCTLIGKDALAKGESVVYTTARELFGALRPSCPGSDERLWVVKETDLLILEDIGPERVTDWATERLGEILEYRQRQCLRTVMTSRLSLERALGRYGPEVTQRARSMTNRP